MTQNSSRDRMGRAYQVAGRVFRDRLRRSDPDGAADFESIEAPEVVNVHGTYDHIHRVLDATSVPYLGLRPEQLAAVDWSRMQVLFINCPGQLPAAAMERIAPWVRRGGYLVTTDWALKHVVEPLFPGTIRHNGQQTADCVVRVTSTDGATDPLLDGFLEDGRDPLWWLEGSSYPIEIVDLQRVRVLLRSREVGDQWGQEPVVVTFEEGQGTVLHLLSHLFLQRGDVRDTRDAQPAALYFAQEMQMDEEELARYAAMAEGLNAAEMSASSKKARMLSNIIRGSRRRAEKAKRSSS